MLVKSLSITLLLVLASAQLVHATYYDEQQWAILSGNYTQLGYNVTIEPNGNTTYLLNGYTSSGYWYQVGVHSYSTVVVNVWDNATAPSAIYFNNTYNQTSYPLFSKVLLTLSIVDNKVKMSAHDWDTGVTSNFSYNAFGATYFGGSGNGLPTSLLTETQPAANVSVNSNQFDVIYEPYEIQTKNAMLGIAEFNTPDGASYSRNRIYIFSSASSNFSTSSQLSTHNATATWNDGVFTTGSLPDPPIPQLEINLTKSNYTFDSGQPLILDYQVSGGIPSYYPAVSCGTYQLIINSSISLPPGAYTCTLTVKDSTGASASKQLSISIASNSLTLEVLHTSADLGVPEQLIQATGGTPPYSYWWSVDGNETELAPDHAILGFNAWFPNATFNFTSIKTYQVQLRARDAAGAVASANLSVAVRPDPKIISFSASNGTAYARVLYGVPPYAFTWYLNGQIQGASNGTYSNATGIASSDFAFSGQGNATVRLVDGKLKVAFGNHAL